MALHLVNVRQPHIQPQGSVVSNVSLNQCVMAHLMSAGAPTAVHFQSTYSNINLEQQTTSRRRRKKRKVTDHLQLSHCAEGRIQSTPVNQITHAKVDHDLGIQDCLESKWPVYYRVIPTPTDMFAVANHVRQNMKFKNNNGWGNFNELITGLSLFIESRR